MNFRFLLFFVVCCRFGHILYIFGIHLVCHFLIDLLLTNRPETIWPGGDPTGAISCNVINVGTWDFGKGGIAQGGYKGLRLLR